MALDCVESYVFGGNVPTEGRALVCLADDSGSPYVDPFDLGPGGIANGQTGSTGFESGSSGYTQDYQVDSQLEPSTHQCFWVDYSPMPGEDADNLIIQPTDAIGNAVGNACRLGFSWSLGSASDIDCAGSRAVYQPGQQRLLVCLTTTQGTPYFARFDIGPGGTANGTSNTTGLISGTSTYIQDYDVDAGDYDPAAEQCFYIPYTPDASATSDTLVLQPTDTNDVPVGNACLLTFNTNTTQPSTSCTDSIWS